MKTSVKQAQSIVGTSPGRPLDDFYPTPEYVTEALMKVSIFRGHIWECACGDGSMSRVLERDHYVISTDINPRGYGKPLDFLESDRLLAPNIITNPPFKLSEKFLSHALELGAEKVALLAKLAFLEGQTRSKLLEKSPLKGVYVFRKRIMLTRNGEAPRSSGMIAFAWFVWEKGYYGSPMIGWI